MLKREVEGFLLNKQGYLKKSPLKVAEAIWRNSSKKTVSKTRDDILKDLRLIKDVQKNLRLASTIKNTVEDDFLIDAYHKVLQEKDRPKRRLFFDIEVSPNIVLSWRIGRDLEVGHDNIIQERAIICICYKWEGDTKISSLQWIKGDDKDLLVKFARIIDSADEVITQNGDAFDIRWLRTRCMYHKIPVSPKFNSIDTLKMARAGFRLNSNKLDYMGQFLGLGKKIRTEPDLWKEITLNNSKDAMTKMVTYCKQDVQLLENVYHTLQEYSPIKKFKYKI